MEHHESEISPGYRPRTRDALPAYGSVLAEERVWSHQPAAGGSVGGVEVYAGKRIITLIPQLARQKACTGLSARHQPEVEQHELAIPERRVPRWRGLMAEGEELLNRIEPG